VQQTDLPSQWQYQYCLKYGLSSPLILSRLG
jgi:hypothetical protein